MVKETVKNKRVLQGEVVSDKMEKTVVVKVMRTFRHPEFGKVVKQAKKYKVHDAENKARCGDLVEISETRPLSKDKHMELVRIVKSAAGSSL